MADRAFLLGDTEGAGKASRPLIIGAEQRFTTKYTKGTKEEKLSILGVMGTTCPYCGGHCLPTLRFVV